jgi:hypothetical protein
MVPARDGLIEITTPAGRSGMVLLNWSRLTALGFATQMKTGSLRLRDE